nr:extracellular solute-binding protein [Sulfitobacter faviae]
MLIAAPAFGEAIDIKVAAQVRDLGGSAKTLSVLLPEGSRANLEPVTKVFTERTGVEVDLQEVHVDQINAELMLNSVLGEARYDVALPATFGVADLVAAGAVHALDGFAARYEPPGFRDPMLYQEGDRFDGKTYGFQTDGDAYLMFYHRDMLRDPEEQARYADRFGYPLVQPETWEELDRQIRFFHAPEAGRYGGLLFRTPGYLAWEWWVRFHAKGYWPLSPDMTPQIADDPGVAALEELIAITDCLAPKLRAWGCLEIGRDTRRAMSIVTSAGAERRNTLTLVDHRCADGWFMGQPPEGRWGRNCSKSPISIGDGALSSARHRPGKNSPTYSPSSRSRRQCRHSPFDSRMGFSTLFVMSTTVTREWRRPIQNPFLRCIARRLSGRFRIFI